MNISKYRYLLEKGGISFLFRMIGMVLTFIIIKLISNYYNIETYGGFSIIQTFNLILLIVFTLGVQNTIVIEHNKNKYSSDLLLDFIIRIFKIIAIVSIIPALILIFLSSYLSDLFNNPELKNSFIILGCSLTLMLFHDIFVYYYIAIKNFLKFGIFMFFLPNLIFLIFIFFTYNTYNNLAYLTLFFCLSYILTFLIEITVSILENRPKKVEKIPYKKILIISIPMMFSGLMQLLLNWTDIFMLGIMMNNEDVGKYNVAFKIGSMMLIFLATISTIILPKLSQFFEEKNHQELEKIIKQSTKLGILISTPFLLGLMIFGQSILGFFGKEYVNSYNILVIIAVTGYLGVLAGNIDQILNMSNNQKTLLYINTIALFLNIGINLILIPIYGALGAAMATLITTILMKTSCILLIKKKLGFYPLGV